MKTVNNLKTNYLKTSWLIIHSKLGHINKQTLEAMSKNGTIKGLNYEDIDWHNTDCLICAQSKLKQFKVPKKALRETGRPFSTGSIDLYGPINVPSLSGYRYGLMFIDNDSSYGMVEFLKTKQFHELVGSIKKWKLTISNLGFELNIIQADSDTIFEDERFTRSLRDLNIELQYAPPGAHQLNGLVERMIQTIAAMSRAMLIASGLPLKYWTYAMNYAMLIYNCTLKTRFRTDGLRKYTSPYEAILGGKPIFNFPIFGCIMVTKYPEANRLPALANRGRTTAFLGFDSQHHNCYIGLHLKTNRIIESKDVKIFEDYYAYTFEPTDYFKFGEREDIEYKKSRSEILDELDISSEIESESDESESETSDSDKMEVENSENSSENESIVEKFNNWDNEYNDLDENDNNDLENTPIVRKSGRQLIPNPKYTNQIISQSMLNDLEKLDDNNNNQNIKLSLFPYPNYKSQQLLLNSGTINQQNFKNSLPFDPPAKLIPTKLNTESDNIDKLIYRMTTLFNEGLSDDLELKLSQLNLKRLKDGYDEGYDEKEILSYMYGVKNTILDGKFEEIPQSFAEAMSPKFRDKYEESIIDELKSHFENESFYNKIYTEEELPYHVKPIDSKWVHTAKLNENGNLLKFKSRLVLRGFKQIYGDSYFQTYSPTASQDSIRNVIAHAAIYGMKLFHWDFKTAYLNSPLEETLFVELFDGFTLNDIYKIYFDLNDMNEEDIKNYFKEHSRKYRKTQRKLYLKAKKAIYGTKQGSKAWYDTVTKVLTDNGYICVSIDECLFYKRVENTFIIFIIYVDDIEGTTNDINMFNDLWNLLKDHFKLVDLGESNQILGCNVTRDNITGNILLSNHNYIDNLLKIYGMDKANYKKIPGKANKYFNYYDCPKPEDVDIELRNKYRMLIGSLLFMANYWRPDIIFMVSHLARFAHIPSQEHMNGALRILQYLRGTKYLGLTYYRNNNIANTLNINPILISFADSNYSGDIDGVSTAGMVIQLIDRSDITNINNIRPLGNVISYFSKRQPLVAESTALAEFIGLWMASHRMFILLQSMKELGFEQMDEGFPFYCDSDATIKSLYNNTKLGRVSKHMITKFNSLRSSIIRRELNLMHIPTEENVADMLTKPLVYGTFSNFRHQIMGGEQEIIVEKVKSKKRKVKSNNDI